MNNKIGILSVQGDVKKHISVFRKLGIGILLVKTPEDLKQCDGLVFPGGESSTMRKLIEFSRLSEPLVSFTKKKPIFATCAGLVLLAKKIFHEKSTPFAHLDISVIRNGWGRQVDSFSLDAKFQKKMIPTIFIRAPKIAEIGNSVKVLSTIGSEIILIEQGNILAATFHPELTKNYSIQQYWIEHFLG